MTEAEKNLDSVTKQEMESREEKTIPGKYYQPQTDIFETDAELVVVMEMPGVNREDLDIKVEKHVLSVDGRIDFKRYEALRPVYTEYNVGHYSRSFSLSNEIDQDGIAAKITDGVLTLTLPKAKAVSPRRIEISA